MAEKRIIKDLTVGSVPKQLMSFAAPLILSGFLQTLYNMVDMAVIGNWVGTQGLAAVSIGGEILHFLMFIAMGMSNAGQIIISQYLGAGMKDRVSKMIGTLFTFLIGAAIVMTVVCFIFREAILGWLNTPAESWDDAYAYVVTCIFGLVFIYGYNMVSAILRGMGDSRHPLLFIAIASILNVILDLVFVGIFDMSALGAALGTVIGQGVSFICALTILYKRREEIGFDFKLKSFGIKKDVFGSLIKLGIPLSIQSAAVSVSMVFISSWVNSYGMAHASLFGVARKIESISNTVSQALSAAGGSMNAQCIGAEKYDRVPKVMLTVFIGSGIIATVMSIVAVVWPEALFALFSDDQAVLTLTRDYAPVLVICYIGSCLRPTMFCLINGSGNSNLNLAVALLDGIVIRIGLALLLGVTFDLGVHGFWYGNAFAGTVPFFIGGAYFISGRWRTRKYLIKKAQARG